MAAGLAVVGVFIIVLGSIAQALSVIVAANMQIKAVNLFEKNSKVLVSVRSLAIDVVSVTRIKFQSLTSYLCIQFN